MQTFIGLRLRGKAPLGYSRTSESSQEYLAKIYFHGKLKQINPHALHIHKEIINTLLRHHGNFSGISRKLCRFRSLNFSGNFDRNFVSISRSLNQRKPEMTSYQLFSDDGFFVTSFSVHTTRVTLKHQRKHWWCDQG